VIQSHLSLACVGSGPVLPEDDKRSASDDQEVTKRSAESVPPKQGV
jgi:hypothetical protein